MRKVVWFGEADVGLLRRVEEAGIPFSRLVKDALDRYFDSSPPGGVDEIAEAVVCRLRKEGLVVVGGCGEEDSLSDCELDSILGSAVGQYEH